MLARRARKCNNYNEKDVGYKGYFAQETAYLDFDILDFEYVKNDESVIVPVKMSHTCVI